jgi:hypothetical protein
LPLSSLSFPSLSSPSPSICFRHPFALCILASYGICSWFSTYFATQRSYCVVHNAINELGNTWISCSSATVEVMWQHAGVLWERMPSLLLFVGL